MYSVEQLPRCDLLRLSPWLGDSSCQIDETPVRGGKKKIFFFFPILKPMRERLRKFFASPGKGGKKKIFFLSLGFETYARET